MPKKLLIKLAVVVVMLGLATGGGWWLLNKRETIGTKVLGESENKYQQFTGEVWDKIKENYWEKTKDEDLAKLFLLAANKAANKQFTLKSNDKNGVLQLTNEIDKDKIPEVADMVLANLAPFGRSRLYSQKEEQDLSNNVNNVEPGKDYFSTLGIGKSATDKEVAAAFEQKTKTATDAAKIAEIKKAYSVLKNEDSRKTYAISGVEPTLEYKLLTPQIYYVHLTKFSPTSLDEFVRTMNKADSKSEYPDTLIFDLRGNIGGAIDSLPYFLGPFIGPDNYAYQFYHQGDKQDFKTVTGWLNSMVRYKKVVILIDEKAQSSAEVMAAVLKKYNVGVVVGNTTKGWGTVEKVIPLDHQIDDKTKYSIFLVHHITLRDDGQPIEGRGVDPMISVKDKNWKSELLRRFNSQEIVNAVSQVYNSN